MIYTGILHVDASRDRPMVGDMDLTCGEVVTIHGQDLRLERLADESWALLDAEGTQRPGWFQEARIEI